MPTQQQFRVLLAIDQSASVLHHLGAGYNGSTAYAPFGFHTENTGRVSVGFNGQWIERSVLGYLLGNGYRRFSPILHRFSAPDTLSPFREGGINSYVYCGADPQNFADPSGHLSLIKGIFNKLGLRQSTTKIAKKLNHSGTLVNIGGNTGASYTVLPTKSNTPRLDTFMESETVKGVFDARSVPTAQITLSPSTETELAGKVILNRQQLKDLSRQVKEQTKSNARLIAHNSKLRSQPWQYSRQRPIGNQQAQLEKERRDNLQNIIEKYRN